MPLDGPAEPKTAETLDKKKTDQKMPDTLGNIRPAPCLQKLLYERRMLGQPMITRANVGWGHAVKGWNEAHVSRIQLKMFETLDSRRVPGQTSSLKWRIIETSHPMTTGTLLSNLSSHSKSWVIPHQMSVLSGPKLERIRKTISRISFWKLTDFIAG